MTARRTVVVFLGGIGDFLLSCPALMHLAGEGPIDLVGNPDRLWPAVAGGVASRAHDVGAVEFHTIFGDPSTTLVDFLGRFDRAVIWMKDDGRIGEVLRDCGIGEALVFPGLPPDGWALHASRYYLDCLGAEDVGPFRLEAGSPGAEHDVVIHPGSGSARKNWPLEGFEEVAAELASRGRAVTWRLGPAEEGWRLRDGASVDRAGGIPALARDLAGARVYLGNDSGVTHLAAAVGCPTVAVFGPTDPGVWAPRGGLVRVVRGRPWPTVDEVVAALGGFRQDP